MIPQRSGGARELRDGDVVRLRNGAIVDVYAGDPEAACPARQRIEGQHPGHQLNTPPRSDPGNKGQQYQPPRVTLKDP